MKNNKGKTALITGASAGIGYEIAKLFARDGVNLVLVVLRKELESIKTELEKQYGIHVETIAMDLSKAGKASELYQMYKITSIQIICDAFHGDSSYRA